jgi:hypothetical protein
VAAGPDVICQTQTLAAPKPMPQVRGRLEIEFTWTDDVRQFYPVSLVVYRQLVAAQPMYLFLDRVLKSCSVRGEYVRTETKRALMMARIASTILAEFE